MHPVAALAALALPTLLVAVDISVMAVALPSIARDLNPSAAQLLWITDSYNYLVAGVMLTMGALADRIGRRRLIMICAAVFAAASAAGAYAGSASGVVVARAVMGVAGSAIMPVSMALIGELFTETKARVQAMGAYMTVFLAGMTLAPFVGGALLAHFWWGSVFLVGVPVMLLTMVLVPRLVPESRAEQAGPIDLVSTGQSLVAVLAGVYALKALVNDRPNLLVWLAIAVSIGVGILFVRRQRRLPSPLLDLALLRDPAIRQALGALLLTALLMGGSSLFFNLYLQEVQRLTPGQAAWWMVPQMVAMIAASNIGPLLFRRLPRRTVVGAMLATMTAGFGCYALLPTGFAGLPLVATGGALATFGIGAAFPLLMDRVMSASPPERAGAGAAMAQLSNELGIAVGLTVLGSLGTVVYRLLLGQDGAAAESVVAGMSAAAGDPAAVATVGGAFTGAFQVIGLVGVAVMIGVLVMVLRRREEPVRDVVPDPSM